MVRGCAIGAAGSLNSGHHPSGGVPPTPTGEARSGRGARPPARSSAATVMFAWRLKKLGAAREEPDQLHDVVRRDPPEPLAPKPSTKSVREALSTSAPVSGEGSADRLERSNWMKVFCVLAPASMTRRIP